MSYQVLARKWRPRDFASLVGQEHVVRALSHALDQQRLHHAYLFTGTRGVGKTTLSRILAKALNCETGITSTPCGVCRACVEIDAGRFIDYVEMDAASNRGVDEMAALLERAVYAPVDARFKVYMIDEVHMLTNHAFNAMLKTLEEPPPHVKFILATTDPQKIPVTVLSRCLQFNLKQMPTGQIVGHLEQVLASEAIDNEPQALRLLAQAAHGSMRDALSLTDQAIAYAAGRVSEEAVRGMLGALDSRYLVRLVDAVLAADGRGVLAIAAEMSERSLSFSTALQDLASLLHRIAWTQFSPDALLDDWAEAPDVARFAQRMSAEQVQLFYQIATLGRNELSLAPDEYAGFTMTLLRMLAFAPATALSVNASTIEPAEGSAGSGSVAAALPAGHAAAASAREAGQSAKTPTRRLSDTPSEQPMRAASGAVAEARPDSSLSARRSPAIEALQALRGNGAATATRAARPAARVQASAAVAAVASAFDAAPAPHSTPAPSAALIPEAAFALGAAPFTPSDGEGDGEGNIATAPPAVATVTAVAAGMDWPTLAAALPVKGLAQQLAVQSELIAFDDDCLSLRVPLAPLLEGSHVAKLKAALDEHFQRRIELRIEQGAVRHTAAAVDAALKAEQQRQAETSINGDPFVQSLIREFGATIMPGSIRPAQPVPQAAVPAASRAADPSAL